MVETSGVPEIPVPPRQRPRQCWAITWRQRGAGSRCGRSGRTCCMFSSHSVRALQVERGRPTAHNSCRAVAAWTKKNPKTSPWPFRKQNLCCSERPRDTAAQKSVPLKNNWREKKSSWPVRILRCMCRSAACVGVENCRSHQDPSSRSVHRPMLCFRHACKQWK